MGKPVAALSLLLAGCDIIVGIRSVPDPSIDAMQSDAAADASVEMPCGTIAMLADDFNEGDFGYLWTSQSQASESGGMAILDADTTNYAEFAAGRYYDFRNGSFAARVEATTAIDATTEIVLTILSRRPKSELARRGMKHVLHAALPSKIILPISPHTRGMAHRGQPIY